MSKPLLQIPSLLLHTREDGGEEFLLGKHNTGNREPSEQVIQFQNLKVMRDLLNHKEKLRCRSKSSPMAKGGFSVSPVEDGHPDL
ncbi:hypothetical protein L1987_02824 [Smallanthus sonchifolius]|uniref:Uncharacterized protein n=1 Tax=Smallanthus sonchifolius TaxID=185202 RepID=A0ACB9K926_9ASTR|nr:hypothetical protein L1987_02824 [Smallanthus sonchifolius]